MATNNSWNSQDPAQVAVGGTGAASLTAYSLVAGGTTSTGPVQQVSGVGSLNQVLTSQGAGALPIWAAASGGGIPWTVVTTTTNMASNNGYFNNSASQTTFVLPATSSVGDILYVCAANGNFDITLNSGQTIHFGNVATTTTTGSMVSTEPFDMVQLVCFVANTTWVVVSSNGSNFHIF